MTIASRRSFSHESPERLIQALRSRDFAEIYEATVRKGDEVDGPIALVVAISFYVCVEGDTTARRIRILYFTSRMLLR